MVKFVLFPLNLWRVCKAFYIVYYQPVESVRWNFQEFYFSAEAHCRVQVHCANLLFIYPYLWEPCGHPEPRIRRRTSMSALSVSLEGIYSSAFAQCMHSAFFIKNYYLNKIHAHKCFTHRKPLLVNLIFLLLTKLLNLANWFLYFN
jgi:hypothetical protein